MNDETRLSSHDHTTILAPNSDQSTVLSKSSAWSSSASGTWKGDGLRLIDGQVFGPYTIVRLLGRGGMGEVYEATHNASGRRVAVKLLRGRIDDGPERMRFLQEGRLAASLSHPNTVYVLGSDEIDGLPVIAMQLVPGGTLKDRVAESGPLPVADAVHAVLDVIGGLDAAASAGILHRDIKPSNCFVDADGRVKVGDFGLSIPAAAHDRHSGFQGTPQFAPPEQFTGAGLDLRADIYAVGATLFYLLTGKAPFEGSDVTELIDRVKHDDAPLAHTVQPDVPPALSAVIARCLSKSPDSRPSSYPELVAALRPFSASTLPARPGVRVVAWGIDAALIGVTAAVLGTIVEWGRARVGGVSVNVDPLPALIGILYYALTECRTGVSLGKRLFGLRVISVRGERTWAQLFRRTLVFFGGNAINLSAALLLGPTRFARFAVEHPWAMVVVSAGPAVGLAAQLLPMRRRNGFMGLHDWIAGTRVVQRQNAELRRRDHLTAAVPGEAPSATDDGQRTLGPFTVRGERAVFASGRLLDAVDPVLKRHVWILEQPVGAAETPAARKEADRVGRLHWLAGHRGPDGSWDAFEAPEGAPLDARPSSVAWSRARLWLSDLAAELTAAEREGSTPVLALDRVWVRPDGRAVLLDWPAPGANGDPSPMAAAPLLSAIGRLSLGFDGATPVPVSAVAMLDRWQKRPQTSLDDVHADLTAAAMSPDRVPRGRRYVPLLVNAMPLVLMMFAAVIATAKADALGAAKGDTRGTITATLLFVGAGMSFSAAAMSVLIRPSGLLMATLGLAVLTRGGREVSRLRALWRLTIAWAPVGIYAVFAAWPATQSVAMSTVPAAVVAMVMLVGFAWALWRPTRGPHDRICGTEIGVR